MIRLTSILVYVDQDDRSRVAVAAGHALARASGASVHVLYMVPDPLSSTDWRAETNPSILPGLHDVMQMEARERLRAWTGEEDAALPLRIGIGPPSEELARVMEELRPDLLVLRTPEGDDDPFRALARDAVDRLPCSILLARPNAWG